MPNPKSITLEWIPSHKNIPGNELADKMAKQSLNLNIITHIPPEAYEIKSEIKKHLNRTQQEEWDQLALGLNRTFLHQIKPVIKKWESSNRRSRQEEVVIARLRHGTCLMTIEHLFNNNPQPICTNCGVTINIIHIFIYCPLYNAQRQNILLKTNQLNLPFNIGTILSDDFPQDLIIKFLKDIGKFDNI